MIGAGGKRLRAALVLLAARLGHYDLERAAHPAAAVELLHTASLVHDDLVDHAPRRRNHATIHTRWGNTVALMLGDYFFALSANELAAEPDPRIISFYANAAQTIVEGELSPVMQLEPLDIALEQYRYKIGCKTAALFEASCKAGIAVAGGTPEQIEALGHFGYDLGLAFQIVDDVLDFTGDERTLGKPAGNDLREGTWTLPLIYAVAESSSPLLRNLVDKPRPAASQVRKLVAMVIDLAARPAQWPRPRRRSIERSATLLASPAPKPPARSAISAHLCCVARPRSGDLLTILVFWSKEAR